MFVLFVELTPKTGHEEQLESLLQAMTNVAAQEEGIHLYSVHRSIESPHAFVLYECYANEAAWEAHMQVPEIRTAIGQFESLLAKEPVITRCTRLFAAKV